jgi:hypothetical protein
VFGWGSRYDDRLLDRLASALEKAETKQLDRWDVDFVRQKTTEDGDLCPDEDETSSKAETSEVYGQAVSTRTETPETPETAEKKHSVTLHNYLGVGVDAKAALAFHEAREKNPKLFFSSITNKALYGVFGAVDFVTHSCRDLLRDHVTITADGKPLTIPRNAEGIIVLNLNSYAGGARMWDAGELGTHRTNIVGALLSGGYEDTFSEDTDTFLSYDECDGEGVLMEVRDDSDDDDDETVDDAQQSSRRKKDAFVRFSANRDATTVSWTSSPCTALCISGSFLGALIDRCGCDRRARCGLRCQKRFPCTSTVSRGKSETARR